MHLSNCRTRQQTEEGFSNDAHEFIVWQINTKIPGSDSHRTMSSYKTKCVSTLLHNIKAAAFPGKYEYQNQQQIRNLVILWQKIRKVNKEILNVFRRSINKCTQEKPSDAQNYKCPADITLYTSTFVFKLL